MSRSSRGFTLVELLVVLAIIATLLSLAAPRYFQHVERSKEAVLRENLATMRDAIDQFHADTSNWPADLVVLAEKRYLRAVPQDPISDSPETWLVTPPPGAMSVVSKVILDIIPPFALITTRLVLGAATLYLVLLKRGSVRTMGRDFWRVFGVGAVGYGVSLGLQFIGTKMSTAANGALVTSATPALVLLFAFWLLLSGFFTPFLIAAGVGSSIAVVWFARRMDMVDVESFPLVMWRTAFRYWPWLLKEIAKSGWAVTRIVLDPKLPVSPTLVRFRPGQRSPVGLVTHANSITLTPGTSTIKTLHESPNERGAGGVTVPLPKLRKNTVPSKQSEA